ncbi:MAG: hypothetical protein SF028_03220 [Candidatus Sumerlaeia bacterium]|nr:hypothetical protein [Candidatus Sumerlaeia bacterium]
MGRTVPTFNMSLEREVAGWQPFRRALRAEDRAAFDRLFSLARAHMAECAAAARPVPFDALVLSVLLEQQKEIERLRALVEGAGQGAAGPGPSSSTTATAMPRECDSET